MRALATPLTYLSFGWAVVAACSSASGSLRSDGGAPVSKDGGPDARVVHDAMAVTAQRDTGARESGSHAAPGSEAGTSETCIGSQLLADLGEQKLLVGGMVANATASSTPIDLRYIYIAGGLFDGTTPCASCASDCTSGGTSCANASGGCAWWGCWQYDQNPPGETARDFVSGAKGASPAQVPMFTYYEILQASGTTQGADEVSAANDAAFMERYFADFRFLLQQIGQDAALVQIEPDFWGFAEAVNGDPHSIPAAVSAANSTDCASLESSIAGMGQCMVSMARIYAPHARVGLSASGWGTGVDVLYNSSPSLDVVGEAQTLATFLAACGASDADFVTVETSDRDAGYYASIGQDRSWDSTNATLPDFTQAFTWDKALTEALGKPALYWQTPLGNATESNTTDHWQDNRVDYFFSHMGDLAAAHVVGVAYGAGASGQTTPESDGGNFIAKVQAYVAAGGQALCP